MVHKEILTGKYAHMYFPALSARRAYKQEHTDSNNHTLRPHLASNSFSNIRSQGFLRYGYFRNEARSIKDEPGAFCSTRKQDHAQKNKKTP